MHITLLQHGDYGEAYDRLHRGGPETYLDQRHSVEFVASLAGDHDVTTVAICDRPHDTALAPRLRSIGITGAMAWAKGRLHEQLDTLAPDLFICRTPHRLALRWAAQRTVPILPIFADIFAPRGARKWLAMRRTAKALAACQAPCVANHSLAASQSLRRLGIPDDRIVPWEWRRLEPTGPPKPAPDGPRFRLFYAGALSEAKGLGDCIKAIASLRSRRVEGQLTVAGGGDLEPWREQARIAGVEDRIEFTGRLPIEQVRRAMQQHDAVIVPSRHAYPEGLPNTIYEALASRTPLIASDHPAYASRLKPGIDSLRFKAGDPEELAVQVQRLIDDPGLYERISHASANALAGLYTGIEWTELVRLFIADPENRTGWVATFNLARVEAAIAGRHSSITAPP